MWSATYSLALALDASGDTTILDVLMAFALPIAIALLIILPLKEALNYTKFKEHRIANLLQKCIKPLLALFFIFIVLIFIFI